MHRFGITLSSHTFIDGWLKRTEVDVANLSAHATNQMVMMSRHAHDISVFTFLPMHSLENPKPDKEIDRPEESRPPQIRVT
jgi:hypothetical protein